MTRLTIDIKAEIKLLELEKNILRQSVLDQYYSY